MLIDRFRGLQVDVQELLRVLCGSSCFFSAVAIPAIIHAIAIGKVVCMKP
jgi:hypothetical protein